MKTNCFSHALIAKPDKDIFSFLFLVLTHQANRRKRKNEHAEPHGNSREDQ